MTTTYVDGFEGLEELIGDIADEAGDIDFTQVLTEYQHILERIHGGYFQTGAGPGGERWKPNATSTVKKKGHGIVLVETGQLRDGLANINTTSIREIVREGANNQHGMSFGTSSEKSVFNADREHVGIVESDVDPLAEMVADHTVEALTK